MLSVKNGTITIHLKLDTWKEPGQKKHIKDSAKHDFKSTAQMWAAGKTARSHATAQTQGCSLTFKLEKLMNSITTNCFHNSHRFTWQRFLFC